MDLTDWRLQGQEKYLNGVILRFKQYEDRITDTDHDHCEFCLEKFLNIIPGSLTQGYTFCPDYFRYFGMQSAQKMAKAIEDKQRAEKFRDPNIYENRKFNLAYDFYESIFGKKNLRKPLTIFVSELKKGEYTSSSIYLNETVFYNFSEFTATFLHEVAHIKGYDGSSNFTDILTLLIQNLLESHLKISTYKLKWDEINDEQLYSNNKNITNVIISNYDVKYHNKSCDCDNCEKNRYKSFGSAIFDFNDYIKVKDLNLLDPLKVFYSINFDNSSRLCLDYSKSKGWEIIDQ